MSKLVINDICNDTQHKDHTLPQLHGCCKFYEAEKSENRYGNLVVVSSIQLIKHSLAEKMRRYETIQCVIEATDISAIRFEMFHCNQTLLFVDVPHGARPPHFADYLRVLSGWVNIVLLFRSSQLDEWPSSIRNIANSMISLRLQVNQIDAAISNILRGKRVEELGISQNDKNMQTQNIRYLTPRQKMVFTLIAKGCSNQNIANELGISVATTKAHVTKIFRKFNCYSRTQLVQIAINAGYQF